MSIIMIIKAELHAGPWTIGHIKTLICLAWLLKYKMSEMKLP